MMLSRKPKYRKPSRRKSLVDSLRTNMGRPNKAPKVDLRMLGVRTSGGRN